MKKRVSGAASFRKLLRRLPDEAAEGMADLLNDFGSKRLAQMRADVPVKSGALKSRLSKSRVTAKSLRLRVGFVGKRANGPIRGVSGKRRKRGDQFVGDQFYGRFVEFGRKGQTVRVTRKGKPYNMRVKAMSARPFIYKKSPLRTQLRDDLSRYWANVLTAASAGVGTDD